MQGSDGGDGGHAVRPTSDAVDGVVSGLLGVRHGQGRCLGGWRVSDGSFKCTRCKAQTAVAAGPLFDRRRTPLTVWFQVCWEFATAKDGVSALAGKRRLQIGSYQTAWVMR